MVEIRKIIKKLCNLKVKICEHRCKAFNDKELFVKKFKREVMIRGEGGGGGGGWWLVAVNEYNE